VCVCAFNVTCTSVRIMASISVFFLVRKTRQLQGFPGPSHTTVHLCWRRNVTYCVHVHCRLSSRTRMLHAFAQRLLLKAPTDQSLTMPMRYCSIAMYGIVAIAICVHWHDFSVLEDLHLPRTSSIYLFIYVFIPHG